MEQSSSVEDAVSADTQAAVDTALARVEAQVAADPDLVHGDVVEQVALESPLEVAVQLCEQAMGFVPDTIRQRLFEHENADVIAAGAAESAVRKAAEDKSRQRSERAAATRAKTLAAEAAAQTASIRSATCPDCFQVRSPSGVCGCD